MTREIGVVGPRGSGLSPSCPQIELHDAEQCRDEHICVGDRLTKERSRRHGQCLHISAPSARHEADHTHASLAQGHLSRVNHWNREIIVKDQVSTMYSSSRDSEGQRWSISCRMCQTRSEIKSQLHSSTFPGVQC
ncbi:hypothetical protein O3P69_001456 [Scylla paramamosain]|uniref:Uncharacterized protein n=1 Tax=Scylla paramamosain TaxID=85552 RepID=A0AAW0UXL1_SCYPA